MFFVAVGVALGLAVALGPLRWAAAPFDAANTALVESASRAVEAITGSEVVADHASFAAVASASAMLVVPGCVALGLVLLTRAAAETRRAVSAVAVVVALCSFAWLAFWSAVALIALTLVVAVAAALVESTVLRVPLVALATVLGASHTRAVVAGEGGVAEASEIFATVSNSQVTGFWTMLCVVVAVAPFVVAAAVALGFANPRRRFGR